jgi:hypothetical protein
MCYTMGSPFVVARIFFFLSFHDTHAVAIFFILPDVMRLAACELSPRRWICERPQEAWWLATKFAQIGTIYCWGGMPGDTLLTR